MQPFDLRRPLVRRPLQPNSTPPPGGPFAEPPPSAGDLAPPLIAAPLHLAAPALYVEARFRDVSLASRLLRADQPQAFTIGDGRRADAPVNPAWLPPGEGPGGARRHPLLEPAGGGFALNLTAVMRAHLRTDVQWLALGPDLGRAEAPLALPAQSLLRVACGEITFEIRPAEPVAPLPRPWLPPRWREGLRYPLAVAVALGALFLVARAIPADPRALSLDTLDRATRLARVSIIPPALSDPEIDRALANHQAGGGGGAPAATGPGGQAGSRAAHDRAKRLAVAGTAPPEDARAATARVVASSLLSVLDGPRTGALADVLSERSALGDASQTVLGNLDAREVGDAYALGGLGLTGPGSGGGGPDDGLLGDGGLGTRGRFGSGPDIGPGHGPGDRYGFAPGVGKLAPRHARPPDIIPGTLSARGGLDKEIIRRIVRRHLNEVKYCYEQALVTRPSLAGRVVVAFSIAPTGRVLSALASSSSLAAPAVDACVVNAVRRWEFPAPDGGGLAMVSYPFSFAPAGQ